MEAIVEACTNLSANLEGCRNFQRAILHSLLAANTRLRHLNLTGLSVVTNDSCHIVARACPHLESLNVSWCDRVDAAGIQAVIEFCPALTDLRAGEVRGFDDLDLAAAIFHTNKLERLVLCGCLELTDKALTVMLRGPRPKFDILDGRPLVRPRKLRHLDLSRCTHLSNAGVSALAHVAPDLQGLQLSLCRALTDAAIESLLPTVPRLSHLELEGLEDITNALLADHLAKAPCAATLEHLSLSYCENIGDVGMLPKMQACRSLRSVDIDNIRVSDLVLAEAAAMVTKRLHRALDPSARPAVTLQLAVYDCQNVTWTGIREVLFRNAQLLPHPQRPAVTYPSEIIGLKCYYGFQMTVNEHQKRLLRGNLTSVSRLERKWAEYMQTVEEAGVPDLGHRSRMRRVREAHAHHLDEDGGAGTGGIVSRRRACTLGACSVM